MASSDHHKEEDEGYLAAESGQKLADNPYPRGTIRYDHWRRGWQAKTEESRRNQDEGYLAAVAGQKLSQNPHPRGTIRYAEWQSGWRIRSNEIRRAARQAKDN